MGEIVLMTCYCLVEGFTIRKSAEMERGAPSVLIEIGGQVVVAKERVNMILLSDSLTIDPVHTVV